MHHEAQTFTSTGSSDDANNSVICWLDIGGSGSMDAASPLTSEQATATRASERSAEVRRGPTTRSSL